MLEGARRVIKSDIDNERNNPNKYGEELKRTPHSSSFLASKRQNMDKNEIGVNRNSIKKEIPNISPQQMITPTSSIFILI